METVLKTPITVETLIYASIEKVWSCWTEPKHIIKWNQASDDWHTPYAENELRNGGKFKSTMAAKNGSVSFDFEGVYTNVQPQQLIAYTAADERKVVVKFTQKGKEIHIMETFEAESENPIELQRAGWQAILNSFKTYVENMD